MFLETDPKRREGAILFLREVSPQGGVRLMVETFSFQGVRLTPSTLAVAEVTWSSRAASGLAQEHTAGTLVF